VLVEIARRLRACVGPRGLVLRWGGEEFLVHVDGGDTAGALTLPEGGAVDWQHALALADQALYRGKQAGRRCAYLDMADGTGTVTASTRIEP
jgi:GGDEF domain-containing protein